MIKEIKFVLNNFANSTSTLVGGKSLLNKGLEEFLTKNNNNKYSKTIEIIL